MKNHLRSAFGPERLFAALAGLVLATSAHAGPGDLLHTLAAPTPTAGDDLGSALATDGTIIRVGAPGRGVGGTVEAFGPDGTYLGSIPHPAPIAGDDFGAAAAIDSSGNLIVGAPGSDAGATDAGIAYALDAIPSATPLPNPDPVLNDGFGSVLLADPAQDLVVVGVPGKNVGGSLHEGRTDLFDAAGTLLGSVYSPFPGAFRRFGEAVALVGTRLYVSEPDALENEIHIYDAQIGSPGFGQYLGSFSGPSGDHPARLGRAMTSLGDVLIATDSSNERVVFFDADPSGGTYGDVLAIVPSAIPGGSAFGESVAARTGYVAVGNPSALVGGLESGAVQVIDGDPSSMNFGLTLLTIDDPNPVFRNGFGSSVAVTSDGGVVVGCPDFDPPGALNAGVAYIFEPANVSVSCRTITMVLDEGLSTFNLTVEGDGGASMNFTPTPFGTIEIKVWEVVDGGSGSTPGAPQLPPTTTAIGAQVVGLNLMMDDISSSTPFPFAATGGAAIIGGGRGSVGPPAALDGNGCFSQFGNMVEFDGTLAADIGGDMFMQTGGPGSGQIPLDFHDIQLIPDPGNATYEIAMPYNLVRTVNNGSGAFEPVVSSSGMLRMTDQAVPVEVSGFEID